MSRLIALAFLAVSAAILACEQEPAPQVAMRPESPAPTATPEAPAATVETILPNQPATPIPASTMLRPTTTPIPSPVATPTPYPTPMALPTLTPLPTPDPSLVPSDRDVLVVLYDSTSGDGWLTDAPLDEWQGVTTDSDGRVTELTLAYNDLAGMLPREIGYLTELRTLDLSINYALVGDLPRALGNLTKLKSLVLQGTSVSGEIPQ